MFERFTDRARRIVVLAQEAGREFGHGYIGTEHILLGLIREENGVGAQALATLGVTSDQIKEAILNKIGEGNVTPSGHIPFTPRAKKCLELSLREALQLGHNYIGTEHILLGLIREAEGIAATVLVNDCGLDLATVRQRIIQLLSNYGTQGEEVPTARLVRKPTSPKTVFTKTVVEGNRTETTTNLIRRDLTTQVEDLFFPVAGRAPEKVTLTYDDHEVTWSWEWRD